MTTPPTTTPWVPMWPLEAATPPDVDGIPADVVVADENFLIRNRFVAGDAQPAYQLNSDGYQWWGAGGPDAMDTNLYRSAAGILKSDGSISAGKYLTAWEGSANQVLVGFNGGPAPAITFGNLADTALYRYVAGWLRTDGGFWVNGEMVAAGVLSLLSDAGSGAGIRFGSNGDTNLYRVAAGMLQTNALFISQSAIYSQPTGASGGFVFNPAIASGNTLLTSVQGEAQPRFYIDVNGAQRWGDGTNAPETVIYRSAAYTLRLGENVEINQALVVGKVANAFITMPQDNARIYMGVATDTSLHRAGPQSLKTDGAFSVAGGGAPPTGASLELQYADAGGGSGGVIFGYDRTTSTPRPLYLQHAGGNLSVGLVGGPVTNLLHLNPGGSAVGAGSGIGFGGDVNLYRSAAANLKTDATFWALQLVAVSSMYVDYSDGGQGIKFGSAADTYIARLSPGVLGINGVAITPGAGNPPGTLIMWAGANPPAGGYLNCDGAAVSRTTYATLFAAIATQFGAGDGSTTFNLPDMRGRLPVGIGYNTGEHADVHWIGQNEGSAIQDRRPKHYHMFSSPTGAYMLRNVGTNSGYAGGGGDGAPVPFNTTEGQIGVGAAPQDGPAYLGLAFWIKY